RMLKHLCRMIYSDECPLGPVEIGAISKAVRIAEPGSSYTILSWLTTAHSYQSDAQEGFGG
ncbi:MAG: hypothetical protein AAF539_16015, partial [Planctomycetota bacterium]